jgi:hypothetical protein
MNDRLNMVLAVSDIKLEQGLDRIGADLTRADRLERVAHFSDMLGLAREGWLPASKQTRLVGSKPSQILR